jgi:hypothetical protein
MSDALKETKAEKTKTIKNEVEWCFMLHALQDVRSQKIRTFSSVMLSATLHG